MFYIALFLSTLYLVNYVFSVALHTLQCNTYTVCMYALRKVPKQLQPHLSLVIFLRTHVGLLELATWQPYCTLSQYMHFNDFISIVLAG